MSLQTSINNFNSKTSMLYNMSPLSKDVILAEWDEASWAGNNVDDKAETSKYLQTLCSDFSLGVRGHHHGRWRWEN